MLITETKWKQISYDEYTREINKHKDEHPLERAINTSHIRRQLKLSVIPSGIGLMAYIKEHERLSKQELDPDCYDYYKQNGFETVFIGSEESIKAFENSFKQYFD